MKSREKFGRKKFTTVVIEESHSHYKSETAHKEEGTCKKGST